MWCKYDGKQDREDGDRLGKSDGVKGVGQWRRAVALCMHALVCMSALSPGSDKGVTRLLDPSPK